MTGRRSAAAAAGWIAGPLRRALKLGGDARLLSAAVFCLGVAPAGAASDLLQYSDFGRADILLTAASIRQSGGAQIARIDQITDASNTDRAIYPTGDGNIADIVQDGFGNQAYAKQNGNLNRVRIVQAGGGNTVSATQGGLFEATPGVGNTLDVTQNGFGNRVAVTQAGNGNSVDLAQTGDGNILVFSQIGNGNSLTLTQAGGNLANFTVTGNNNVVTGNQVVGGPVWTTDISGSGQRVKITAY